MTALVGILNKRAAVMAADSAMTVVKNGNVKIYNTATKIFSLSKEHPVGVMIDSSMEFMGTPWDVIFKLYRDRKGGKEYKTLRGYVDGFLDFLRSEDYFSDEDSREDYFISELREFYDTVKDEAIEKYRDEMNECAKNGEPDEDEQRAFDILKETIEEFIESGKDDEPNPEFKNYSIESMRKFTSEAFDSLMQICEEDGLPTDMRDLWERGFYAKLCGRYFPIDTELVFMGYGSDDIYPSLLSMRISGVIDRRLRYYIDEEGAEAITNSNSASICPFAQTDVMMSLMKGMSNQMYRHVDDCKVSAILGTKQKMMDVMKEAGATEKMLQTVDDIDLTEVADNFDKSLNDFIHDKYVDGIFDAVDSFSIEEMANMAESLISVTNLQRHISSTEESVGGPVDVAVITRSEGFVWVKHKEWFNAAKG